VWSGLNSIEWHNDFANVAHAERNIEAVMTPDAEVTQISTINVAQAAKYAGGYVLYDTQFHKGCKSHFLWRIGESVSNDYGADYAELHEQGGKGWPEDS
jgi:hypothetical protein